MRTVLAALFTLIALPAAAGAQKVSLPYPGQRLMTLTAGVGNAMGYFGVQGERYVLDERVSIYAGVGYTPREERGERPGPTFAAGLRSFTGGIRHRLFLEASASQVVTTTEGVGGGGRYYGPGLQAGYQYVARGGFTAMVSIGAGYALGVPRTHDLDPWAKQLGIGVGYTWRRTEGAGRGGSRWSR